MTLSRKELIAAICKHDWWEPLMRVLANGPRRFSEIRNDLVSLAGGTPGEGYIGTQLKSLESHSLVKRTPIPHAPSPGWALTQTGHTCLTIIDNFDNPTIDQPTRAGVTDASRTGGDGSTPLLGEPSTPREPMDTTTPHPARRYNYWLGGKDHFAADRESGDLIERAFPQTRTAVRENRGFLQRAVGHLAGQARITQFLDIGTGLPTADNTHEVAQRINPYCRIAYVDNDPMVMTHARALLTSTPEGRSCYIEEDLRNPDTILNHPEVQATLDFDKPVALMLVAVLHFIKDDNEARDIVRHLLDALPPGSYLAASNFTTDFSTPEQISTYKRMIAEGNHDTYPRNRNKFGEFFDGLDLVDPGIVAVSHWRPSRPSTELPLPENVAVYGAVGRKNR